MIDSSGQQTDDQREIHLLDYWRTIWRGRWPIVSVFVVVFTLVAIGTFTQTPIYRARATVEISSQSRKVAPIADVAALGTGGYSWTTEERYFNSQYEIIRSRDISRRVFDRLDLYNHPRFKNLKDPIGALSKMIRVNPIKDTGIVEISLEGTDPEEVATWVNTVAAAYVDRNLDQAIQATAEAVRKLFNEIDSVRLKLQDRQQTSFDLAEESNLYVPENQQKIVSDRLSSLQDELTQTQVKRVETESILKQIDSARAKGDSFESLPRISNDPAIQDLYRERIRVENQKQRLLVTLKEKHFRVQEAQSEIDKLNQKLDAEAERIVSNLETDSILFMDREKRLIEAIDETRAEALRIDRKASSYELARGEATDTRRLYDLISARVKEIDLSQSLLSNNVGVLDQAPVPNSPIKPRTTLNLAVGAFLGLLLGIGLVFFLDYIDNTVRSAEDIEQFLKLNLLAIVPKDSEETGRALKEAYQTLRTSLLFSRKHREANSLLVTSAGPQEGKSLTLTNLGRVLANAGDRVLLLDCDLRRPVLHQRLGIERDRGLTNYILSSEGDDWRNYVKTTKHPNLFALTCGPIPPNPPDVFGHERFQALLKDLRAQFDWVFIDSPPIISITDSMILASQADMVAFVVRHNGSDKDLIRRCVNNVRKINPNVIGAVLNCVDLGRAHYKDYYYMGYYYYGESAGKGKKSSRRRPSQGPGSAPQSDVTETINTRSVV